MAIVLPVAVGTRLAGSAVLVGHTGDNIFFATCLHLFGQKGPIHIALPPHGGDCRRVQQYGSLDKTLLMSASVVTVDPFADIAILRLTQRPDQIPAIPPIVLAPGGAAVGAEVVVLGYPYAPLGSLLETWTPSYVTAIAKRVVAPSVMVDELVLSTFAHIGSSGSAVMGKHDGVHYGIVRGSLAPPSMMSMGGVPLGSDSSVTFATSAHVVHGLLETAIGASEVKGG